VAGAVGQGSGGVHDVWWAEAAAIGASRAALGGAQDRSSASWRLARASKGRQGQAV
jgi:hypothetical protein